jgi:hypothetical protein
MPRPGGNLKNRGEISMEAKKPVKKTKGLKKAKKLEAAKPLTAKLLRRL